jgi:CarD family transcriptional regulator
MSTAKKPVQRQGFKTGEFVVYPAHGVGQITGIEDQEIAGFNLELFVINFEQDKLTLRVPIAKIESAGMRKLASEEIVTKALKTVRGRARVKRTMWSRRAQEYEAKINSGSLISISEVVRDLFRSENQPEQSYSERQLYEAALERMSREISAVNKISATESVALIEKNLALAPKRGPKNEEGEASESDEKTEKAA